MEPLRAWTPPGRPSRGPTEAMAEKALEEEAREEEAMEEEAHKTGYARALTVGKTAFTQLSVCQQTGAG